MTVQCFRLEVPKDHDGFDNFKMGQGDSKESINCTNRLDLESFPDEILLMVLSFVPERDLILNGRLVNKRVKHLIDSPSVWRIKCERENWKEILLAAELCPKIWQIACVRKPFSRNLLRNPCGTEGLAHWNVVNGGDGWRVEPNFAVVKGAASQTSFVTSFLWCMKSQIVDLIGEGLTEHFLDAHQPYICISDWYAGRQDCGCAYELKVQLLAVNKQTALQAISIAPDPIPQWNNMQYHQVYYEFRNYSPGVRYVKFAHKGKNTQFWKGWYGARISNSSVTVECDDFDD
ncbi:F-box only protein 27-like [Leptodactylus fuscus]|uniref:F-box only protein 27-like n=1 Tax=Leptodactylus fuscus TaxID=238119 RepID=UPI003F4EE260